MLNSVPSVLWFLSSSRGWKSRCEIVSCLAVQLLIPANAPRGTVKPLHSVCRACHVKYPDALFWFLGLLVKSNSLDLLCSWDSF